MTGFLDIIRRYWAIALTVVGLGVVAYVGYGCGKRSQAGVVADLTTRLVTSEQTIEVEKGLFAKKNVEVEDLKDLLTKLGEENQSLADLAKKGQMEVISLNELALRWRRAYEAEVKAHQSEEPPIVPGESPRKRVDFTGRVGPIGVVGHTLTDPPAAFLRWEQVDPLRIIVAITKNRDGTYSTLVRTSDDAIAVDIKNAVLDLSSLRPTWRQRIWLEAGVDFLMGEKASLGASYHLDRHSVGASCSVWEDGRSCGLTIGYRPFR